jgi:universal stress protein A
MTTNRILVPVDFSDWSEAAVVQAEAVARAQNARLLIVHVHEPTAVYTDMGVGAFPVETNREALQGMLEEVRPNDPRVEFEHRLLEGVPAEEIVRCADKEKVSMIVISTHGRRGVSRMLMGSVAEAVVRRANVPVLTVKSMARPLTISPDEPALTPS